MSCDRQIGTYPCCSVIQGDCLELMKAIPDGCVDAVITDPVWPNCVQEVSHGQNPYWLWSRCIERLPIIKRLAVVLGCNSDPFFLGVTGLKFFRVCWLEYVRPHYLGRLMY